MPEAPSVSAPSSVPSTAPGPEDGDVSAASAGGKKKQTMLGEFFGGCKERYNKFNYRLGQMGEEANKHYKEIQATSDNSEVLAFIEDVIQSKGKPVDTIIRKRKIASSSAQSTTEGWVSWNTAATQEGEEVLLELVETRAIASRIHPKLGTTSKVPYPKNLQVWLSTETSTKKKETCDEETLAEGTEVNPETHEKVIKKFATEKIATRTPDISVSASASASPRTECGSLGGDDGEVQDKKPR